MSLKTIYILISIIFSLFVIGCSDKDDTSPLTENETEQPIETENNVPQSDTPEPFNSVIDSIRLGMEKENADLYIEAFWDDDYSYYSDSGTDDPADDVTFDNIGLEKESIQRLFSDYDNFSIKFTQIEIKDEAQTAEVKSHHQLLASVGKGKSLPGGYQKILAEGISVFSFKKLGVKWCINKWKQEEMTKEEIFKAYADLNQKPPEGALIQTWGLLKAR